MYAKVLSVTAINNYIKKTLDNDFIVSNANIAGEISNFKHHSSGHLYFSLKDETSKINCVMFRKEAETLNFLPKDGMKVVAAGRVSVYPKEGNYQLYCNEMKLEGTGELYAAFIKLKGKLEEQGYFREDHKKSIPTFSQKIGVITSPTGAAIRDIINVTRRRNKGSSLLIYPTQVQGVKASKEIIQGINYFNTRNDIDVLIIARGGGSIEELWSFNDEELAYAIYGSQIPIITGVGHETDFTIADFVSDRRAPTPSAATEIAVFDAAKDLNIVNEIKKKIQLSMDRRIKEGLDSLEHLKKRLTLSGPENYIINQYSSIEFLKEKLNNIITFKLSAEEARLSKASAILNLHNPLNVLGRGFAMLQDEAGIVVSRKEELIKKDKITVILKDGKVKLDIRNQEAI